MNEECVYAVMNLYLRYTDIRYEIHVNIYSKVLIYTCKYIQQSNNITPLVYKKYICWLKYA